MSGKFLSGLVSFLTITIVVLLFVGAGFMTFDKTDSHAKVREKISLVSDYVDREYYQDALNVGSELLEDRLTENEKKEVEAYVIKALFETKSGFFITEAENYLAEFGAEVDVLKMMTEYYYDSQEYENAFLTLERGKNLWPENPEIEELAERINGVYEEYWCNYSEFILCADDSYVVKAASYEENEKNDDCLLIDFNGDEKIRRGRFKTIFDYTELPSDSDVESNMFGSRATFLASVRFTDGRVGYVDQNGDRRVSPQEKYEYLGCPRDGYILVKKNGKWGYLKEENFSETGTWYEDATSFSNGVAGVKKDGNWYLISAETGERLSEHSYMEIAADSLKRISLAGCIWVKDNDGFCLIDLAENKISDYYDNVKAFVDEEGTSAVCKNKKWGQLDSSGNEVIACQYDEMESGRKGFSAYKNKQKWGIMQENGKPLIEADFDKVLPMGEDGTVFMLKEDEWKKLYFFQVNPQDDGGLFSF